MGEQRGLGLRLGRGRGHGPDRPHDSGDAPGGRRRHLCDRHRHHAVDARAKVGVRAIDGALGRVGRLRGYTYEMARQPEPEPRSRRPRGAGRKPLAVPVPRRHTGLLAQEVADVLPEAVFYRPRGDEAGRLAFAKRAPGGSADTADSADVDVAHIDADMDVGGPVASIAYGNLAGLFVGAINELRETVDRLAARVEALESKP